MNRPKITASEMTRRSEAIVKELVAEGRRPSLQQVLAAVAETREKFVPLIKAARANAAKK